MIVGAGHCGQALCRLARDCGWQHGGDGVAAQGPQARQAEPKPGKPDEHAEADDCHAGVDALAAVLTDLAR